MENVCVCELTSRPVCAFMGVGAGLCVYTCMGEFECDFVCRYILNESDYIRSPYSKR